MYPKQQIQSVQVEKGATNWFKIFFWSFNATTRFFLNARLTIIEALLVSAQKKKTENKI